LGEEVGAGFYHARMVCQCQREVTLFSEEVKGMVIKDLVGRHEI